MTKTNRTLLSSMFVAGLMASPLGFAITDKMNLAEIRSCKQLKELALDYAGEPTHIQFMEPLNCVSERVTLHPIGTKEYPFIGVVTNETGDDYASILLERIERNPNSGDDNLENGLFGVVRDAEINDLYLASDNYVPHVEGKRGVGGLVGTVGVFNLDGPDSPGSLMLDNIWVALSVSGTGNPLSSTGLNENVGGIVGAVVDGSPLKMNDVYSASLVKGYQKVGGIVGRLGSIGTAEFTNVSSGVELHGCKDMGGLVGLISHPVVGHTTFLNVASNTNLWANQEFCQPGNSPTNPDNNHGVGGLIGTVNEGTVVVENARYEGRVADVAVLQKPDSNNLQSLNGLVGRTDKALFHFANTSWSKTNASELYDAVCGDSLALVDDPYNQCGMATK